MAPTDVKASASEPEHFAITVAGIIDPSWSAWFDGLSIASGRASDGAVITILRGPVADQSALRGILTRLWDLNLHLLSLHRREETE